ncbi:MAG: hypothetical protein AABZ53_13060 [Planctomycetota bacterium]
MPTVRSDVQDFKVGDRGKRGTPILDHPAAERLGGTEVIVEGGSADARDGLVSVLLGLAEFAKETHDLAGRYVAPVPEAAPVENPLDASACKANVLLAVAL